MKIVLMGNGQAAINCLDVLLSRRKHEILLVIPHTKKVHAWHASLEEHARERGLTALCDPEDVNHPLFVEHIRSFAPDLILSVYYDQIFNKELLDLPKLGCVNVHPALLPKFRGVAPLIWALIEGEKRSGVTFHLMERRVDTGDILLQERFPITEQDTGFSVHQKAAALVGPMTSSLIEGLEKGTPWKPRKQKGSSSFYSKSSPQKNRLDWSQPAVHLERCVRALAAPLPGCFTHLRGEKVQVWKAAVSRELKKTPSLEPGQVYLTEDRLWIHANPGWLELLSVGVSGIRMSGVELARRLRLSSGDKAGEDGSPAPAKFIAFGAPSIGEEEIAEVVSTLRSGWIGPGHKTELFENEFAEYVGAKQAIAVNSCTAALHLGLLLRGVGPGDEVITTPLTFAATHNAILYTGATPVMVDIDPATLNIDPARIESAVTKRTKAIVPVHFGGRPCAMDAIRAVADKRGLAVIEDAAHAVGAVYRGRRVGGSGDIACFSFYANKNITTGEGGMLAFQDEALADRARVLRLHGLNQDAWKRFIEKKLILSSVQELGYKYTMSDLQASLGIHQLRKLEGFMAKREAYATKYDRAFRGLPQASILPRPAGTGDRHALHLYILRLNLDRLSKSRDDIVSLLREKGVGAAIHYQPVHLHPFYRERFGYKGGEYPHSEKAGRSILSLPLSPAMSEDDVELVMQAMTQTLDQCRRAR